MARKVVGKINKEMKQDVAAHVNSKNKTDNGAGRMRTVSAPPSKGIGAVYKDDDDI